MTRLRSLSWWVTGRGFFASKAHALHCCPWISADSLRTTSLKTTTTTSLFIFLTTTFYRSTPTFFTHICPRKSQQLCEADFLSLQRIPQIKKPSSTEVNWFVHAHPGNNWSSQYLNPQLTPKPVHFQLYCVNPPSLAISLRTLPVIWERISENRVLCKPLCNKRFKGSRYFDA